MLRVFLCGVLLSSCLLIASSQSFGEQGGAEADIVYEIRRNDKPIGRHEVFITEAGDRTEIDIAFKIKVKVAFITVFKMSHTAHETWSDGGKLQELSAVTDRKEGRFVVYVVPEEGEAGYQVTVNGDAWEVPPGIVPTSFTNSDHLFGDVPVEFPLFDTLSGRQRPSLLEPKGEVSLGVAGVEQAARYYEITNLETEKLSHRIWLAPDNLFYKIGLFTKDGHYIEYYREV